MARTKRDLERDNRDLRESLEAVYDVIADTLGYGDGQPVDDDEDDEDDDDDDVEDDEER